MKTEMFNYDLPAELIAQSPPAERSDSRLLVLGRSDGSIIDSWFREIGSFLRSGDCLVLNDTKVLPARFFAQRQSGGKLEGLFLAEKDDGSWDVMLKGARKVQKGEIISLKDNSSDRAEAFKAELLAKGTEGKCVLKIVSNIGVEAVLEKVGFPPLPPYIKRDDDTEAAAADMDRYQTVYADKPGAVAAPTAGLHFTEQMIEQLKSAGITFAYVTLHVGAGTFKPVTAENIEDHKIHSEFCSITAENAEIINRARLSGGRIVAVGTTSVRTLETAARGDRVEKFSGSTELFIKPGYEFKMVDAMITNFHLPKSTLLALVGAFAGVEQILKTYRHAARQRYRFYSYGDAMLII